MKYPVFWKKLNCGLAFIAGCLVFAVGILAVMEAILRGFFASPTKWTLNLSCYMLIWIVFLSSPYAFQTHGHVLVDLFRDLMDKAAPNRVPRRIAAIIGYLVSLTFVSALLYAGLKLVKKALKYGTLTTTTIPIPLVWLQIAIVVGCVLMIITLLFIVLDLLSGSDEFL